MGLAQHPIKKGAGGAVSHSHRVLSEEEDTMVVSILSFFSSTKILLTPFDPGASWLYITQQERTWIFHLEGYD